MMGQTALTIVPAIIGTAVALVIGLPAICAFILSGRVSRAEERKPLHRHTCSKCGRVQEWIKPFDTFSPCRACQLADLNHIEIDLEQFADADAIRVYLNGADVPPSIGQPSGTVFSPSAHPDAG